MHSTKYTNYQNHTYCSQFYKWLVNEIHNTNYMLFVLLLLLLLLMGVPR